MRSRSFAAAWAPPSRRKTRVGDGIPSSSTMASTASAMRRQRGSLNSSRSHRGATSGHASGIMMAAARALRSASGSVNGRFARVASADATLSRLLLIHALQLVLGVGAGSGIEEQLPPRLVVQHVGGRSLRLGLLPDAVALARLHPDVPWRSIQGG